MCKEGVGFPVICSPILTWRSQKDRTKITVLLGRKGCGRLGDKGCSRLKLNEGGAQHEEFRIFCVF